MVLKSGGARVAILDVDVHPGNGNEDTWYSSAAVLNVNISEEKIWPGNCHGDPKMIGTGRGAGYNLNFPMPTREGDCAYVYVMLEHVLPVLADFDPEVIFVA